MRYLIACPLEIAKVRDFVRLRDELKYLAPKWKITLGPHITIMRPGEAICEPRKATDIFQSLEFGPTFVVDYKKFGVFKAKKTAAVYAEPSSYQPFEAMRGNLLNAIPKLIKSESGEWNYHPHLTLINRLPIENLELIMYKLKTEKLDITYNIDSVVLYKKDLADDVWAEISKQDLKKS